MSDKQGQGERLYIALDGSGTLWGADKNGLAFVAPQVEPIPADRVAHFLHQDYAVFELCDIKTERAVPKGAEVWTDDDLFGLCCAAARAARHQVPTDSEIKAVIAQARGKGE